MTSVLSEPERLGKGVYAAAEIARFAVLQFHDGAMTTERAERWLRGVVDDHEHTAGQPDYSFKALISVFTIEALRRQGVPLQRIRRAQQQLQEITGDPLPFARGAIFTDNRDVFAKIDTDGQLSNLNVRGEARAQEAVAATLEGLLTSVQYAPATTVQGRVAQSWMPSTSVLVDPEVQLGAPCIEGTRIPTSMIADLAARSSIAQVAWEYELDEHLVRDAVAFERRYADAA